jgi:hypothetical protein
MILDNRELFIPPIIVMSGIRITIIIVFFRVFALLFIPLDFLLLLLTIPFQRVI